MTIISFLEIYTYVHSWLGCVPWISQSLEKPTFSLENSHSFSFLFSPSLSWNLKIKSVSTSKIKIKMCEHPCLLEKNVSNNRWEDNEEVVCIHNKILLSIREDKILPNFTTYIEVDWALSNEIVIDKRTTSKWSHAYVWFT